MSKFNEIRNGYYGVQYYDENGDEPMFYPKGRMVEIESIMSNIETGTISYDLKFINDIYAVVYHEITRSDLLGELHVDKALINKGADITQQTLSCFRDCFGQLLREGTHPKVYTYNKVGFQNLEYTEADNESVEDGSETIPQIRESLIYKSGNLIAPSSFPPISSKYTGAYDLRKFGSYLAWRDMILNDVVPHTKLLIAFLGGASAIITGLIGNSCQFTNPIFHLYGLSSTGKSCAAKVIASIYGRPFESSIEIDGVLHYSIYGSWTATENAVRDSCTGNQGMTVILNELGKSKIKDFSQLIYDFSEGTTKKRSSGDGIVNQREGYRTSFVSVGEYSIFTRCSNILEGLLNRVMELKAPFTEDAAHAKRLEKLSYDNCGHAAEIMASYIFDNGNEVIVKDIYNKHYNGFETKILSLSPNDNRFISTFAAPILTTAELANAAWKLNIDLNEIEAFLLNYLSQRTIESDLTRTRFDTIIELCLRNQGMFCHKGSINSISALHSKDVWGTLEHVQSDGLAYYKIWLHPTQLRKLCKENDMPSAKHCMSAWKERGWIESEPDRLTKRDKYKVSYYVLVVKDILAARAQFKSLDFNNTENDKEENNENNDCA